MNIKKLHGVTTYWSYGGGPDHLKPGEPFDDRIGPGFGLQRAFCDNFRFHYGSPDSSTPNGDGRLQVERTPQGFYTDSYLEYLKSQDIKTIWCTQGRMGWQNCLGRKNKINPVDDSADRMNPQSWFDAGEFCRQIAIRYADDTADMLAEANVWSAEKPENNWWLSNEAKAGLGILDAIEIGNEWNFPASWSEAKATLTPQEYAVMFMVCYDAIRSVSENIEIIMGGGLGGSVHVYEDLPIFLETLERLYADRGRSMPIDFSLCFHWYMREDGGGQGGAGTRGESPEKVDAYKVGLELDRLCEEYGLEGWYNTETGWSADADGSLDTSKNSAPVQEGLSQLESQAVLMQRLTLIWGATKYCKGITYWHCRDHYDSGAFLNGGVCAPDWSPKPALTWSEEFLDEWGDYNVITNSFVDRGDGTYEVVVSNVESTYKLGWSDEQVVGDYTPVPTIMDSVTPPEPEPEPTPSGSCDCKCCKDGVIEVNKIEWPGVGTLIVDIPIKLHL